MRAGRTHVALNAHSAPTAAFVRNANWQNPGDECVAAIVQAVGAERVGTFDADRVATQVLGDSIFVNPMILGFAWQKGWVPLGHEALMRAIELNNMAVAQNKAAFEWGRHCAAHWDEVQVLLAPPQVVEFHKPKGVDALIEKRREFLVAYQNSAYADTYFKLVERVRLTEGALHKTTLTEAVARNLFKLMAYKDEYEVARLHTDTAFLQKIDAMFEGDFTLNYHLAPPLISKTNAKGELQKQKFGPFMLTGFKLLKHLKVLRGSALDVFGYTDERRTERELIGQYLASVEMVLGELSTSNHALAVEMARIPEQIKGFGHVKARHLAAAREKWEALKVQWATHH
jgi:indolepyruvate ferredoxin oxidoreductase